METFAEAEGKSFLLIFVRVALGMFGASAIGAGLNGQYELAGVNFLTFLAVFAAKKFLKL